jgi:hypothetical protein
MFEFGNIASGSAFAFLVQELELMQKSEVAKGGVLNNSEVILHLAVGNGTGRNGELKDGSLALAQFCQNGLGQALSIRCGGLNPAKIVAWARESEDKAILVEGYMREFQTVIEHSPPHAADTGAALLHEFQEDQALAEKRVSRA